MFRRTAHRRLIAWLALLAMALIVVMPAASRVMPMAQMMGQVMGMDASCAGHMAGMQHAAPVHSTPDHPADSTDRCGYCVLLDHQSALASGKVLHLLPVAPATAAPLYADAGNAPASPILSARPRGPPQLG